jgi:steroid delta-isomerase-like uncharacterized protein
MSTESNKGLVRRFVDEVLTRGDTGAVEALVADGFVSHTWPSTGDGKADLALATRRVHEALADVSFSVADLIAQGDRVAARLTASARQVGELVGRPASGRSYTIGEIHSFRIAGGRIAEHWHQYDAPGMLRQLGAISGGPGREHAPSR